jgi:hypothetical protein
VFVRSAGERGFALPERGELRQVTRILPDLRSRRRILRPEKARRQRCDETLLVTVCAA